MGKAKDHNSSLPTLSVLIANYNYARFISDAFESVFKQSYKPLAIVVIDNASTDNSIEVVEQFIKRDPTIRLIVNERNMGIQYQTRLTNSLVLHAENIFMFSLQTKNCFLAFLRNQ